MPRGFVDAFLLPLVKGGTLHVGRPIGRRRLERDLGVLRDLAVRDTDPRRLPVPAAKRGNTPEDSPVAGAGAARELERQRWRIAVAFLARCPPPPLDEVTLRLGHAVHGLLASLHPELAGLASDRRQLRVAAAALELADVGPPATAIEAVNRHSLLSRLDDIARSDHTVFFWAGRRRLIGVPPPPLLMMLPRLRNVRVETTRRAWLREIGVPAPARPALLALHKASPLGEALDPLRLDPSPSWSRILPVLRFAPLARIVAGRIVDLGVDLAGDALAGALFRFVARQEPAAGLPPTPEAAAFAIQFLAHVVWLDDLCAPPGDGANAIGRGAAGLDLAAILGAAADRHPSLVWPRDVSPDSDLGRRFDARLARYRALAVAAGDRRPLAAAELCRFAVGDGASGAVPAV